MHKIFQGVGFFWLVFSLSLWGQNPYSGIFYAYQLSCSFFQDKQYIFHKVTCTFKLNSFFVRAILWERKADFWSNFKSKLRASRVLSLHVAISSGLGIYLLNSLEDVTQSASCRSLFWEIHFFPTFRTNIHEKFKFGSIQVRLYLILSS